MKFRLLSSKREVKIVPISFGLVKKRVAKWPIWSFCYHGLYIYIYIYISDTKAELVLSSPLEVNCDMIITFISLIGQLSH